MCDALTITFKQFTMNISTCETLNMFDKCHFIISKFQLDPHILVKCFKQSTFEENLDVFLTTRSLKKLVLLKRVSSCISSREKQN